MAEFFIISSTYPTAIYTVLLGVVLVYWILALVGFIDIEGLDLNLDTDSDGISALASFALAMGLGGVPFSIVISLLVVQAWLLTYLGSIALGYLPWIFQIIGGTLLLIVSAAVAIPITAKMVRPLRGLFVTHQAVHNRELVGQNCRITTLTVSEKFGQAFLADGGAGLNLKVRATTPNNLSKGGIATIIEYHPETDTYEVIEKPSL